jgi:cytochrome c-type biogenesis protein CcmH
MMRASQTRQIGVLNGILFLTAVLLAGVIALQPSPVRAQSEVSDDEVNAIAKQLYCPICENTPLDVCPTQACKDWRELIRQQLSQGQTEEQIIDYFVANYGPQVLAEPPAKGFSTLVWILPVVALIGGGIALWRLLRQWQNRPPLTIPMTDDEPTTNAPDVDPEILARVEGEINARF